MNLPKNKPLVVFTIMITNPRPGQWYDEALGQKFMVYINPSIPGVFLLLPSEMYTFPVLGINPADCVVLL